MRDQVVVVFEHPSDMTSFLQVAQTAEGVSPDGDTAVGVISRPISGSKLGAASPSTLEVVILSVNALSAAAALIGLYLNRYGRKNITILHTPTERRYSISGMTGVEAASVLQAAASDGLMASAKKKETAEAGTVLELPTETGIEAKE